MQQAARATSSAKVPAGTTNVTEYWSTRNVTFHHHFISAAESLDFLHWRNSQYLFIDELMPTSGFDDKVILDYGCGPGHDVVGFVSFSKPRRVIAMDVSPTSVGEAAHRLSLHGASEIVEFHKIEEEAATLPLDDHSVDYIHSAGVLHHVTNLDKVLGEFRRVLKPDGFVRIMVYNYDSLWVHLYVAFLRQIVEGIDAERPLYDAFRRSTDGPDCPVSRCYKPAEFAAVAARAGFDCRHLGNAVSVWEMSLMHRRFEAIMNPQLKREHRDFLKALQFDAFGRPLSQGHVAGIDSVFQFEPRS